MHLSHRWSQPTPTTRIVRGLTHNLGHLTLILLHAVCTGQRPASAASSGSAKRSWADEFYDDAAPLPPLPAADDFPSLGGGAGGGSVAGAWGNSSHLKSSRKHRLDRQSIMTTISACVRAAAPSPAPGATRPTSSRRMRLLTRLPASTIQVELKRRGSSGSVAGAWGNSSHLESSRERLFGQVWIQQTTGKLEAAATPAAGPSPAGETPPT